MSFDNPIERNRVWWDRQSDSYQEEHGDQLSRNPAAWGVWGIAEQELKVLGDVAGKDVLEFGCGGAQWSIALAKQGARVVGMDLSGGQLAHANEARSGSGVSLVHANGEETPFADGSFDLVFCDHGAMSFARPERTVAEASRLLRPGGKFAFNIASPFIYLCWDDGADELSQQLRQDYFGLYEIADANEAEATAYQIPYGDWIRLFRANGFVVEDLIEIRPPEDAKTSYTDYAPLDWARRWPAESLWIVRKSLD